MRFLHGSELTEAMRDLVHLNQPMKIAVAYWGRNALDLLDLDPRREDLSILCCLEGGKSAPEVIRRFGKRALQNDRLHAKVMWTPARAIVGSANASSNGMPTEETIADGLIEAGVVIEEPAALLNIERWFNEEYRAAREISENDLKRAQDARDEAKRKLGPWLQPELIDIPLSDLKRMNIAVLVWAVEVSDEEEERVGALNVPAFMMESAAWFLDKRRNAKRYPYDYNVLTFRTSEDRVEPATYEALVFFPQQTKWLGIGDGWVVVDAHYIPAKALRIKIGRKSVKAIQERLSARKMILSHDLRQTRPEDGFVSWEPLIELLKT